MIVTLTANPSLDRTVELGAPLARGDVQRALTSHQEPGGKGVNVSRAVRASGLETVAVLPGDDDDALVVAVRALGIEVANVPVGAPLRSNLTLTEPDGTTTKINEPGPRLSAEARAELVALVAGHATSARWLVLAGSVPPGAGDDFYVDVLSAVDAAPTRPFVAVDGSGAPFEALVSSGHRIDLIKPNAAELAEVTGEGDEDAFEADPAFAAAAAGRLIESSAQAPSRDGHVHAPGFSPDGTERCDDHGGVRAVLCTLGSRGAVLVTRDGSWFAPAPRITARSTVGAGDSSLAGFLYALTNGASAPEALAQAVAHGAAAASLPGSTVPSPEQTHPGDIVVSPIPRIAAGLQ